MKYRIVEEEGKIYLEYKWLIRWYKIQQEIGWGFTKDKVFKTAELAEEYLNEMLKPKQFKIIKEF